MPRRRRQVPGGLAGIAVLGQHAGQHRAGKRILQLADQGRRFGTAHRLAGPPQPIVRDAQRVPRHGQHGGVAGRGARLQSLPGVAAGQLVVPQASVAFAEPGQRPALSGLVGDLPEQRQGLLGLRSRLGPVAHHEVRQAGVQVRPGLAGQVTGLAEVIQGPGQILVASAGEREVPADGQVGPAQRRLVLGGFGGVQHGLADGPDVGPVPWPPTSKAWPWKICQAWVMKPAAAAWAMAWSTTWCSARPQSCSAASSASCSGATPGADGATANGGSGLITVCR